MKFGIIDIGSNSVRLLIKDGDLSEKFLKSTRLAENKKDGLIDKEASLRTIKAISEFANIAKEKKVDKIFAFATAAVRNSVNGKEFVISVENKCGIKVDVLSGDREAEIGVKGALSGKDGGIIDVGGGSTEVAVVKNGKIVYSKSLPYGAVVLTDRFGQNSAEIKKFLKKTVSEYGQVPKSDFYCIGGSATSIAAIAQNLDFYDAEKVNGYNLSINELSRLTSKICALSVEERSCFGSLQRERAGIIHAGACTLLSVARYLGLNSVTVSESDNLEGYLSFCLENK